MLTLEEEPSLSVGNKTMFSVRKHKMKCTQTEQATYFPTGTQGGRFYR